MKPGSFLLVPWKTWPGLAQPSRVLLRLRSRQSEPMCQRAVIMPVNTCILKNPRERVPRQNTEWCHTGRGTVTRDFNGIAASALLDGFLSLRTLLWYTANCWKWMDFKRTHAFQDRGSCFARCRGCLRGWCLGFLLFRAVAFSTEHVVEIRHCHYKWKSWRLDSRSVDFPSLKRTQKKNMEESWFCSQFGRE